jgi:hypothetical protein
VKFKRFIFAEEMEYRRRQTQEKDEKTGSKRKES